MLQPRRTHRRRWPWRRLVLLATAPAAHAQSTAPITIRAARVLDGKGAQLTNAIVEVGAAPCRRGSAQRARHLRPGQRHADAGHDRRARPHRLPLRQGWPRAEPGRDAGRDGALRGRERVGHARSTASPPCRASAAPSDKELRDAIARGVLPGPRILTLARLDERADRHARARFANTSASRSRPAPTSSRSSRQRASATAAARR